MSSLVPVIRYLIVCEDVVYPVDNLQRISLLGLIHSIRARPGDGYPLRHPELCVFVQYTECRSPGQARVEVSQADSGLTVYRSDGHALQHGIDPLAVHAACFRVRDLGLSQPGLYYAQFVYNNQILAQQPILAR